MKFLILTILCVAAWANGALGQVAVVAHKSVPVDSLAKSELLDLYTGDTSVWSDGAAVVIFDLKEKGETREVFYKFLGMASSRIKSIWLKRMLSGEADPPEALKTEEELLKKVAATPGAIGFLSQSKQSSDVKTLLMIAKEKTPQERKS